MQYTLKNMLKKYRVISLFVAGINKLQNKAFDMYIKYTTILMYTVNELNLDAFYLFNHIEKNKRKIYKHVSINVMQIIEMTSKLIILKKYIIKNIDPFRK